jgi:hypothetical protein
MATSPSTSYRVTNAASMVPTPSLRRMVGLLASLLGPIGVFLLALAPPAFADPEAWLRDWPHTDSSRHAVRFEEIISGGPAKDGIPSIDHPSFVASADIGELAPVEPVISVRIGDEAHAYPLRIMIWHEIVNDIVGGVPIAVTWCPLCNSAVVFDRRIDGRTLSFGTTGKLRDSDLVMYDRETESWWQQFLGECIVGTMLGKRLTVLPARVESIERFRARFPKGEVLVAPADGRAYGRNPYVGYDTAASPFLYRGHYAEKIPPLARVVAVGEEAWTLDLLRSRRRIETGDLVLTWEPGQASPLDSAAIDAGQEIGNVVVVRRTDRGSEDAVYDVSFTFAFRAFHPRAPIHSD